MNRRKMLVGVGSVGSMLLAGCFGDEQAEFEVRDTGVRQTESSPVVWADIFGEPQNTPQLQPQVRLKLYDEDVYLRSVTLHQHVPPGEVGRVSWQLDPDNRDDWGGVNRVEAEVVGHY